MRSEDTDVLVIGAGISGLACAAALSPHVGRIVVVDADAHTGGRAASWTDAHTGDRIDIGAHILLTEYRNMLRFLDMLGTPGGHATADLGALGNRHAPPLPLRRGRALQRRCYLLPGCKLAFGVHRAIHRAYRLLQLFAHTL